MVKARKNRYSQGLIAAVLAQTLWGLLPVYWKWMADLAPYQILVHRVIWSFVFLQIVLFTRGKNHVRALLRDPTHRKTSLAGGVLVSINWLLYIWSVNTGRILEASLGYYIMPLLTGAFGLLLGETFSRRQGIAFGFAAVGVLVQMVALGRFPVFALILALVFAGYTVVKKKSPLNAMDSLYAETLCVLPFALLYLVYSEWHGSGITGNLPQVYWLRAATTGVITAVPLLLYGYGVQRIPLRVTAFAQYLNPTISLLLGVLLYKETFSTLRFVSFLIIWIGVVLFTADRLQSGRAARRRLRE